VGVRAKPAVAGDALGHGSGGHSVALEPRLAPLVTSIRYAESTDTEGFDRCIGTGAVTIESTWKTTSTGSSTNRT
jgi:hypothetical protein